MLTDQGIPFVIKMPGGIAEYPLNVGPMAEFVILVDEARADAAHSALDAMKQEIDSLADDIDDPESEQGRELFFKRRSVTPTEFQIAMAGIVGSLGLGLVLTAQGNDDQVISGVILVVAAIVGAAVSWRFRA
jgi:hypothetical protein